MKSAIKRFVITTFVCLIAYDANAIVVVNDSGSTSQQAPVPGWSHTGELNSGSGVYLGDGWVLTASHVGAGTLRLPVWDSSNETQSFVEYAHDPSSVCRVQNPSNPMAEWGLTSNDLIIKDVTRPITQNTDMVVFRLNSLPALASLSIPTVSASPSLGDSVTMIGTGLVLNSNNPVIVGNSVGPASNPVRWGTNQVVNAVQSGVFGFANSGSGDVYSFATRFDDPSGTGLTTEAQAQSGDSGGSTFAAGSETLLGLIHAVSGDAGNTDFDDWTILASIAHYYEYANDSNRSISSCISGVTAVPEPGAFVFVVAMLFGVSGRQWLIRRREFNAV